MLLRIPKHRDSSHPSSVCNNVEDVLLTFVASVEDIYLR